MTDAYTGFSRVYDRIMAHVGYEQWADYVEELLARHGARPRHVLDLACGTGSSSLPFARRGYRVTGVDLSPPMLAIAREKAAAAGLEADFRQGDMRDLAVVFGDAPASFDLVICLYDSINYILDHGDLTAVFRGVERLLAPGGLFIFDVNSAHRLSTSPDTTTLFEEEDLALVWENTYDRDRRIWQVTLTGFLRGEDGRWERFREVHRERAYTEEEMAAALAAAGLGARGVYGAFGTGPPAPDTPRIYYVVGRES
ncbi:MAG: class I SAM-dependent methyltransferase [bacterium]|nr:class I SAM-dependent methyltransferase [bacterium]